MEFKLEYLLALLIVIVPVIDYLLQKRKVHVSKDVSRETAQAPNSGKILTRGVFIGLAISIVLFGGYYLFDSGYYETLRNKPEPVVESEWSPEQPNLIAYYAEQGETKYKLREEKYYEDGVLEYSGGYDIDGKRHGDWKYNYPNGNLWSIGTYDHGKKTGPKKVYWPEGHIRYEGSFENDEKSGRWVFYDMEGNVLDERTFPSPAQ